MSVFTAEEKLIQMGDAAIPALEPLATSSGFAPARQYAINILAQIGSEQAVHLLLRILEEEPDVMVRALICRHLGRLGVEEAVPIIGKWLFTIRGKAFDYGGEPQVMNLWYAWAVHVHALREIGSEKGIPVLEEMLSVEHGGRAGREFSNTYRFPDNARGPFRLRITANLYIPADGNYRFYVKTEVTNRATLSITRRDGKEEEIISPRNEGKLPPQAAILIAPDPGPDQGTFLLGPRPKAAPLPGAPDQALLPPVSPTTTGPHLSSASRYLPEVQNHSAKSPRPIYTSDSIKSKEQILKKHLPKTPYRGMIATGVSESGKLALWWRGFLAQITGRVDTVGEFMNWSISLLVN